GVALADGKGFGRGGREAGDRGQHDASQERFRQPVENHAVLLGEVLEEADVAPKASEAGRARVSGAPMFMPARRSWKGCRRPHPRCSVAGLKLIVRGGCRHRLLVALLLLQALQALARREAAIRTDEAPRLQILELGVNDVDRERGATAALHAP